MEERTFKLPYYSQGEVYYTVRENKPYNDKQFHFKLIAYDELIDLLGAFRFYYDRYEPFISSNWDLLKEYQFQINIVIQSRETIISIDFPYVVSVDAKVIDVFIEMVGVEFERFDVCPDRFYGHVLKCEFRLVGANDYIMFQSYGDSRREDRLVVDEEKLAIIDYWRYCYHGW